MLSVYVGDLGKLISASSVSSKIAEPVELIVVVFVPVGFPGVGLVDESSLGL